jgi:uracil-DNA glycosylase family 4
MSQAPHPQAALDPLAALAWQVEAGADEAVADEPTVWTEAAAAVRARALAPAPPGPDAAGRTAATPRAPASLSAASAPASGLFPGAAGAPLGAAEAAAAARAAAAAAATLAELEAAVRAFEGCPLKDIATSTVFADGPADAPVMIVGEAPGREEDQQGRPFVGASGRLLDRMLALVGLDRTRNACITNMVFWRPPGNRDPSEGELAACLPFVLRHVELRRPKAIVTLGRFSSAHLAGTTQGITRIRGTWHEHRPSGGGDPIPVLPTFHPAYLLRNPLAKRESWRDLLSLKKRLDSVLSY